MKKLTFQRTGNIGYMMQATGRRQTKQKQKHTTIRKQTQIT